MKALTTVHHLLLGSAVVAAACGSAKGGADAATADDVAPEAADEVGGLVLHVVPTEVPVSADAATTVLAQSVSVDQTLTVGGGDRDLGTVRLVDPVVVGGSVTGLPAPTTVPVAALPGAEEPVPVPGEVRILHDSSVQSYRTPLDAAGRFDTRVIPEADYQMAVVPDDPSLPLAFFDLSATEDLLELSFDIGAGVPVYGFVTSEGEPVAEAEVVVEQQGVETASVFTDARGFYELRAAAADATVRCLGRDPTVDPMLEISDVPVPPEGLRRDFAYEVSERVLVEARLQDVDGSALADDVEVRFTARSLDGLETQKASFVTSDVTGQLVLVRLPPGVYDVEVLPPAEGAGASYTPTRIEDVVVEDDTDLGTLVLEPTWLVRGTVSDPRQQLIASVAVACREDDFGRRSWSTVTDAEGAFELDLPQVSVTCSLTPPVEFTSVALTRRRFDPRDNIAPSFQLAAGQTVSGRVARDGEGEPLVVVELRDRDELLLGSALTDDEGAWTMQVDLSSASP